MRFSEKQLTILTVVISGVLALASAGVGYFVLNKKLNKTKTDLINKENQLEQAHEKLKVKHKLIATVEALREDKKYLTEILPTMEEMGYEKLIDTFSQLEQEANVILLSASVVKQSGRGGSKLSAGVEQLSYKLNLTGEFFELIKFIYLLETHKRFIKVNEFNLSPKNISQALASNEPVIHNMNIQITTYTYTQ